MMHCRGVGTMTDQEPGLGATQLASTAGTAATMERTTRLPVTIGRFEIQSKLGDGGMGTVLLATDPLLGRQVALKMLHGNTRNAESSKRRLLREAQGIARLSHENVIVVHEVGTHEEQVYLAMEYVAGSTLARWQAGRAWRGVLDAYLRAGQGLVAAHDAGLVHRDFKPDNVLVGDDGRLRVSDFGLVSTADATQDQPAAGLPGEQPDFSGRLTQTGVVMGTPRYMAPEQYRADPVDARADQFAFCAALYEGVYGKPAFAGTTLAELSGNILEGRVQEVPADSDVPVGVRDTILRGLSTERADRYPTLRELLQALAAAAKPREPVPRRRRWPIPLATVIVLAAATAIVLSIHFAAGARDDEGAIARAPAVQAMPRLRKEFRAVGPAPGTPPEATLRRTQAIFDEAGSAYLRGDYDAAEVAFEAAYAQRPYAEFLFDAAACFQVVARQPNGDVDDYTRAIALYRQYRATRPTDAAEVETTIAALEGEIARVSTSRDPSAMRLLPSPTISSLGVPALRGLVVIESSPPNATIYLDDRLKGPFAITPWAGRLVGEPKIIIEQRGYGSSESTIEADPSKLFVMQATMSRANNLGWVEVTSDVPNADVYQDDKAQGVIARTPYTANIAPGKHTFWVSAPGHTEYRKEVVVDAGKAVMVDARLASSR